jgi:hypothetical protein
MFHPIPPVVKMTTTLGRRFDGWQKPWDWLTEPSAAISEPDQRRQARLLAGLLVSLMPLTILASLTPLIVPARVATWPNEEFYIAMVALIFFAASYGLSRTRRYMAAAALMVAVLSMATFAAVAFSRDFAGNQLLYRFYDFATADQQYLFFNTGHTRKSVA